MDWFPVISQLKSFVQAIFGDTEGARKTQMNFVRQCPGISQVYAVGACLLGNKEEAKRSQMECVSTMAGLVDSVPVVGHVKGFVHYLVGDTEGGDNSMKSASRTAVQIAAGVGVFMVGGPVGATEAWTASGYAMDFIITWIDSAIHHEYRPSGFLLKFDDAVRNPKDPGKVFDVVVPSVLDLTSSALATKAQPFWRWQQKIGKKTAEVLVMLSDDMMEIHKSGKIPPNTEHIMSAVYETDTGRHTIGHNSNVRNILNEPLTSKPSYGKSSCAEIQALERAKTAGLKPDTVVTIKKVPGGTAPAYTCDSCEAVTKVEKLNVPTDYNRGEKLTTPIIPSKIETRIGTIRSAMAAAVGRMGYISYDISDNDSNIGLKLDKKSGRPYLGLGLDFQTSVLGLRHRTSGLGSLTSDFVLDFVRRRATCDTEWCRNSVFSSMMSNLGLEFGMKPEKLNYALDLGFTTFGLDNHLGTSDFHLGSDLGTSAVAEGGAASFGTQWCQNSAKFVSISNFGFGFGMRPERPSLDLCQRFMTSGFDNRLSTFGSGFGTSDFHISFGSGFSDFARRWSLFGTQWCQNSVPSNASMSNFSLGSGLDVSLMAIKLTLKTSGLGLGTSDSDIGTFKLGLNSTNHIISGLQTNY